MPKTKDVIIPVKTDTSGAKSGLSDMKSQLTSLAKEALPIIGLGTAIKWVGEQAIGSMKETIDYANEVRGLSQVTGMTAEESSRLIQVLDDHKVSVEAITKATKTLAKEGYTPNIKTIASLSDQYLGLNNQVDRNNFLIKNFGREGTKWVETMQLGSKAILSEADAVDQALIANDKFLLEARRAEMELDNWNDKVAALKMQIGIGLIGVLDGSTAAIQKNAQEIFKAANGYEFNTNQMGRYTEAQRAAWEEAKKQAEAEWMKSNAVAQGTQAIQDQTQAQQDLEASIRATTDANNGLIGTVQGIAGENQRYKDTQTPLAESQKELLAEKLKLLGQGYNPESQKIQEINDKMAENKKAMQDNEAQHKQWVNAKVGDLLLAKLSQDGLSDAETSYYLTFLKNTGQITEADQTQAEQLITNANDIAAGFDTSSDSAENFGDIVYHMGERSIDASGQLAELKSAQRGLAEGLNTEANPALAEAKQYIDGIKSKSVSVDIWVTVHDDKGGNGSWAPSQFIPGTNQNVTTKIHAAGGAVMAGQLYSVNEMGKPEYFLPHTSGQIKPAPSNKPTIAMFEDRQLRKLSRYIVQEGLKAA